MSKNSQRTSLFSALTTLADEIQGEKTAAAKPLTKAAGPTPADPGGYQGATTHATKDVDNGVQNATEGSRSSENSSDVKEQQRAPAVDNTSEKSQEGRQDEVQYNIGTNASATGEDASVEDDYKPGKDDPGSSHPARTDNDSLDGHKYASMSLSQLLKASADKGNALLADISVGLGLGGKPAAGAAPATKQAGAPAPALANPAAAAAIGAGYELAATLGLSKEAAHAQVQDVLAQSILDAHIDADLLAGALKQAADEAEMSAGEDNSGAGDIGSGAGEGDPTGGGDMGGGAPVDPAAGGGAPPGGDVPLEQQPPGEDEALQELGMALQEMGMTPQELLQILQGAGAGGAGGDPSGGMGGGMPPGGAAGGMPPGGAGGDPMAGGGMPMDGVKVAAILEGRKLAKAAHNFMRSGKFQVKEARTKRSRQLRDTMKSHVQEVLSAVNG